MQQSITHCAFGRGHYEKHFCEIILNVSQWFKRRCLQIIFLFLWRFCLEKQDFSIIIVQGKIRNITQ